MLEVILATALGGGVVGLPVALVMKESIRSRGGSNAQSGLYWGWVIVCTLIATSMLLGILAYAASGNQDVIPGYSVPDLIEYIVVVIPYVMVWLCIVAAHIPTNTLSKAWPAGDYATMRWAARVFALALFGVMARGFVEPSVQGLTVAALAGLSVAVVNALFAVYGRFGSFILGRSTASSIV